MKEGTLGGLAVEVYPVVLDLQDQEVYREKKALMDAQVPLDILDPLVTKVCMVHQEILDQI